MTAQLWSLLKTEEHLPPGTDSCIGMSQHLLSGSLQCARSSWPRISSHAAWEQKEHQLPSSLSDGILPPDPDSAMVLKASCSTVCKQWAGHIYTLQFSHFVGSCNPTPVWVSGNFSHRGGWFTSAGWGEFQKTQKPRSTTAPRGACAAMAANMMGEQLPSKMAHTQGPCVHSSCPSFKRKKKSFSKFSFFIPSSLSRESSHSLPAGTKVLYGRTAKRHFGAAVQWEHPTASNSAVPSK